MNRLGACGKSGCGKKTSLVGTDVKSFIKVDFRAAEQGGEGMKNGLSDLTDRALSVIINNCISVAKMPKDPSGRSNSGDFAA